MDIPQPPQDEDLKNIIDRLANFVARNGKDFENMTKAKQRENPNFEFLFGGPYYNYYTYRVTTEQALLNHQLKQAMQQSQQPLINSAQSFSFNNSNESPSPRPPSRFGQQSPSPLMSQQLFSSGDGGTPGLNLGFRPGFNSAQFGGGGGFEETRPQNPTPPLKMSRFDRGPSGTPFPPPALATLPSSLNPSSLNPMQNQMSMSGPLSGIQINSHLGLSQLQQNQVLQKENQRAQSQQQMTIESLLLQKKTLEEQVSTSEKNLAGQHAVLISQQQAQVEEALRQAQDAEIEKLAQELGVDLGEFRKLLYVVMETCTKESIANGKAWIFTHSSSERHYELIAGFLLRRVTDVNINFTQRLHIIYLVNDTLHHCVRKGAHDFQSVLERVVIPMFSYTKCSEPDEENIRKLDKLLSLWESKPNYISKGAVEKLGNAPEAWTEYKNELVSKHASVIAGVANGIQKTFEGYQGQHLIFVQHINNSIKLINQEIENALILQKKQRDAEEELKTQEENLRVQDQLRKVEELRQMDSNFSNFNPPPQIPPSNFSQVGGGTGMNFSNAGNNGQSFGGMNTIPDLSRPPPGFLLPPPQIISEIPRLPYFELPAGLMVPLVKPEDDNYKAIDPSEIRLPPPCPPSERLIAAIEAFYGPPSHDNPRDGEGWERLGLYEYYKNKNLARKQKEDDIREGRREKSRSPTPIRRETSPGCRSPPRRRYSSKSPTAVVRRKRSRSRSPSRRRRRRSRSRSRSPLRRSPTPPSFGTVGFGAEKSLDETNKGHQLLRKMGWGGTGLGANEQGIEAPVRGGELRDRIDQYKGVGINLNDPFESYRKTKGQAFVDRMRARGDDRP